MSGTPRKFSTLFPGAAAPGDGKDQLNTGARSPAAPGQPPQLGHIEPAEWELLNGHVLELDIDQIDDSPFQPAEETRDRYEPEGIDDLAHTIAHEGQREPVQVRRVDHRFELIAGHRRIRAMRSIGWTKIRAMILVMDDAAADRALMAHNEGRKSDPDYRKAKRYKRAIEQGYVRTQDDVALMFGTKQTLVSKRLRMLTLPAPILALLDATPDLFSLTTAATLHELVSDYPNEIELITQAVARISTDGANENSVRGWVVQAINAKTKQVDAEPARDDNVRVINNARGRPAYTVKLAGRVITVRLGVGVDPAGALDELAENLRTKQQEKQADAS